MKRLALALTAAYLASPLAALADTTTDNLCKGAGGALYNSATKGCSTDSGQGTDRFLSTKIGTLTETLIFVTGAIAVLIIIIGGIRYVTSTGDATRIKQAKDTVFYAIIGLIVAILAFAIVRYVSSQLG